MLRSLRQNIIEHLLHEYRRQSHQLKIIECALREKQITQYYFDHFAMIDLPSVHTGIPQLMAIFKLLGFAIGGRGYLPEKQNDFVWLYDQDTQHDSPHAMLPQAVVADFRLDELPLAIRAIISKYAKYAKPFNFSVMKDGLDKMQGHHDQKISKQIIVMVTQYLSGRDWPLPTIKEFSQVWEFNQLLAWVLVFGRKPNHFTLSIHLLNYFNDLNHFHSFIENEVGLQLNIMGGAIKGGKGVGLAQSSTMGAIETISLANGTISLPTGFVEFIFRYPKIATQIPLKWSDFFTGFLAQQATHVIQSLGRGAE